MTNEIIRTTQGEIEPTANNHPVVAYLAGLSSAKSRKTMLDSLNRVAELTTEVKHTAWTYPWQSLTFAHTSAIRSAVAERFAPASANLILAAVRGVLKACWRLNLIDGEIYRRAIDIRNIKNGVLPRGRSLNAGEIRALFGACASDQSSSGRRDAALLAILYGAGMRRSEAVKLNRSDYNAETGTITVKHGKGRKQRIAYLSDGARQAVNAWLTVRGDCAGPLLNPITKGGVIEHRSMTAQAVYARLKSIGERAGIKNFSPHDLRRTFVSDLLDAGADVSLVQQLAGHANVTTTQRYDRRPEHAKKKAAQLLHVPFENQLNALKEQKWPPCLKALRPGAP